MQERTGALVAHTSELRALTLSLALVGMSLSACAGKTAAPSSQDPVASPAIGASLLTHLDAVPKSTSTSTVTVTEGTVVLVVTEDGVATAATDELTVWPDEGQVGTGPPESSPGPADEPLADDPLGAVESTVQTAVSGALAAQADADEAGVVVVADATMPASTLVGVLAGVREELPNARVVLAVEGESEFSDVLEGRHARPEKFARGGDLHVVGPFLDPAKDTVLHIDLDEQAIMISSNQEPEGGSGDLPPLNPAVAFPAESESRWSGIHASVQEHVDHAGAGEATVFVGDTATVSDFVALLDVMRERRTPAEPVGSSSSAESDASFAATRPTGVLVERVALARKKETAVLFGYGEFGDAPDQIASENNEGFDEGFGYGGMGGMGEHGEETGDEGDEDATAATIAYADPVLRGAGSCEKENVETVVKQKDSALHNCYERQLVANPELSGKIIMQWKVQLDGKVGDPFVKSSEMKNSKVERCLSRVVKRMRFDKPDGGVCVIEFPFAFNPGG